MYWCQSCLDPLLVIVSVAEGAFLMRLATPDAGVWLLPLVPRLLFPTRLPIKLGKWWANKGRMAGMLVSVMAEPSSAMDHEAMLTTSPV